MFEPASGQTRYTRHVQIPLQGLFRLVGPVMKATGAADKRNARFVKPMVEAGIPFTFMPRRVDGFTRSSAS